MSGKAEHDSDYSFDVSDLVLVLSPSASSFNFGISDPFHDIVSDDR